MGMNFNSNLPVILNEVNILYFSLKIKFLFLLLTYSSFESENILGYFSSYCLPQSAIGYHFFLVFICSDFQDNNTKHFLSSQCQRKKWRMLFPPYCQLKLFISKSFATHINEPNPILL
jgi:hypothetical protein